MSREKLISIRLCRSYFDNVCIQMFHCSWQKVAKFLFQFMKEFLFFGKLMILKIIEDNVPIYFTKIIAWKLVSMTFKNFVYHIKQSRLFLLVILILSESYNSFNSSRYFTRRYSDSNKNKTSNNDIAYEAEYYYRQVIIFSI